MSAAALSPPAARRRSPLERLEALCDPGSVRPLRSRVVSPRLGARAIPGDGVLGATGSVDGRPIGVVQAGYHVEARFVIDQGALAQVPVTSFYQRLRQKFGRLATPL